MSASVTWPEVAQTAIYALVVIAGWWLLFRSDDE